MLDLLLHPAAPWVGGILFLLSGSLLLFRRKKLFPMERTFLLVLLVLSALYLLFILWLAIMMGSNAHPPSGSPQPHI